MTQSERAALQVLGLKALPKSERALQSAYRKAAKQTHPDVTGSTGAAVKRVYKAHEVLSASLKERDTPKVFVRFGDGDPRQAIVVKNPEYSSANNFICKYATTVKWFVGMSVRINTSAWREVDSPQSFDQSGVFIRCV